MPEIIRSLLACQEADHHVDHVVFIEAMGPFGRCSHFHVHRFIGAEAARIPRAREFDHREFHLYVHSELSFRWCGIGGGCPSRPEPPDQPPTPQIAPRGAWKGEGRPNVQDRCSVSSKASPRSLEEFTVNKNHEL